MKKDVLIISTSYMNLSISGNNRSNYIPMLLAKNGYNVEKICPNFNHHTKQFVKEPEKNLPYKITLIKTIGYKKNVSLKRILSQIIFAWGLKKYLEKRKKPDVIYLFLPSIGASYVVRKFVKKHNIKLIIDIRDLWPEAFKMVFRVPILNDLVFFPFKVESDKIYQVADEIIAVSETYKNRALKVRKKATSANTIYLGTELKTFDEYAKDSLQYKQDDNVLLVYVGTLGNSYDLITAFDALSILKERGYNNLKLLIMGSGPLESKFKNYAIKKKINVEFTGRIPYPEMVSKLVKCDIALNPIRKGAAQSIINKHADYAAAGLPVINTQECNEYRTMVEKYNIGLNAENSDAKDMADKIEILINDQDLRKIMGRNHRRLAEAIFDREKTYKKILELI